MEEKWSPSLQCLFLSEIKMGICLLRLRKKIVKITLFLAFIEALVCVTLKELIRMAVAGMMSTDECMMEVEILTRKTPPKCIS